MIFKYLPVILIGILIIVAILLFSLNQNNFKQSQQVTDEAVVVMKQDMFEPQTLEIKKATRVTFKNEDSQPRWPASNIHPTHGIYPEFDPKQPIEQGKEWSFIFAKVGSWKYHDHLIPSIRGEIVVSL